MKALHLPTQTSEQLAALDELYRATKDVRIRQRVQLVLLASEKGMVACEIAAIVRLSEQSVRNWLKRYVAEGIEGLQDQTRPGVAPIVTEAYREQLLAAVRRRPRSLGLAFSSWTCQRLAARSAVGRLFDYLHLSTLRQAFQGYLENNCFKFHWLEKYLPDPLFASVFS